MWCIRIPWEVKIIIKWYDITWNIQNRMKRTRTSMIIKPFRLSSKISTKPGNSVRRKLSVVIVLEANVSFFPIRNVDMQLSKWIVEKSRFEWFFFHCYDKEEEKNEVGNAFTFSEQFHHFPLQIQWKFVYVFNKEEKYMQLFSILYSPSFFFADISITFVRLHCTRKFTESHELTEFEYYLFLYLVISNVFAMNYSCCAVFIRIFSFFGCFSLLSNWYWIHFFDHFISKKRI